MAIKYLSADRELDAEWNILEAIVKLVKCGIKQTPFSATE